MESLHVLSVKETINCTVRYSRGIIFRLSWDHGNRILVALLEGLPEHKLYQLAFQKAHGSHCWEQSSTECLSVSGTHFQDLFLCTNFCCVASSWSTHSVLSTHQQRHSLCSDLGAQGHGNKNFHLFCCFLWKIGANGPAESCAFKIRREPCSEHAVAAHWILHLPCKSSKKVFGMDTKAFRYCQLASSCMSVAVLNVRDRTTRQSAPKCDPMIARKRETLYSVTMLDVFFLKLCDAVGLLWHPAVEMVLQCVPTPSYSLQDCTGMFLPALMYPIISQCELDWNWDLLYGLCMVAIWDNVPCSVLPDQGNCILIIQEYFSIHAVSCGPQLHLTLF